MKYKISDKFNIFQRLVIVLLILSFICIADLTAAKSRKHGHTVQRYVIFDTDQGVDDGFALLALLKAEKLFGNVKVLAITCGAGNTDLVNVLKNTLRILYDVNRMDIPVYAGASVHLIPSEPVEGFYGVNGRSGYDVCVPEICDKNMDELIQPESAAKAIRDFVLKYPKKITMITLGALTNMALAVKTYPEIADKIYELQIMGGNFNGNGNMPTGGEYNFYIDAVAAYMVLNTVKCPITILPWETCSVNLNITTEWRFSASIEKNCKETDLLNAADKKAYRHEEIYTSCDVWLVSSIIFPQMIKSQHLHYVNVNYSRCELGQMIVDEPTGNNTKCDGNTPSPTAMFIELLDKEETEKALQWVFKCLKSYH